MSTFKIIKKGTNDFWHWFNNDAKKVAISSFAVVLEEVSQTFSIVYINGANVPQQAVNVLDIEVIDETDTSDVETFTNVIDLRARLVELGYTAYLIGGGGGSQDIDDVLNVGNTSTDKELILDTSDVNGGKSTITPYSIKTENKDTGEYTESLDVGYYTGGNTNISSLNPNGLNVSDDSATSIISVLKNFIRFIKNGFAGSIKIDFANPTTNTIFTIPNETGVGATKSYADAKVEDAIVDGVTDKAPSQNAVFDGLALKVDKTTWIDYSDSSTIVGWASYTTKLICIKKLDDNLSLVMFQISGVSNATTSSFTLDVEEKSILGSSQNVTIVNSGSASSTSGRVVMSVDSNLVDIRRDALGTAWSSSGTKTAVGQFFIKTA